MNPTDRRVPFERMWSQRAAVPRVPGIAPRAVVDYALARRSVLTALAMGRVRREDVCDATVYLRRAARYHGEPADVDCPLCRRRPLLNVTYTYGDSFSEGVNGRARPTRDLPDLAREHPEFRVYVVEVCVDCGWNHLVTSYLLGTGAPAATERRRRSRARTGR
jgi:hypothetical protein